MRLYPGIWLGIIVSSTVARQCKPFTKPIIPSSATGDVTSAVISSTQHDTTTSDAGSDTTSDSSYVALDTFSSNTPNTASDGTSHMSSATTSATTLTIIEPGTTPAASPISTSGILSGTTSSDPTDVLSTVTSNTVRDIGAETTSSEASPATTSDTIATSLACHAADLCYSAVRGTTISALPTRALQDCSSFFKATVSPCPTTVDADVTVTHLTTVTVTEQTTNLHLETVAEDMVTTVRTLSHTATVYEPSLVLVTEEVPAAPRATRAPDKRRNNIPQALEARSPGILTATCSEITIRPSSVPTYASECAGAIRYSSVCECLGATGTPTTLPQQIITSTLTQTETSTITVTHFDAIDLHSTVIQTNLIPTTLDVTATTVVLPSFYTETTTLDVSSTVVASPAPSCSLFRFQADSGPYSGQFITSEYGGDLKFSATPNAATSTFQVLSRGALSNMDASKFWSGSFIGGPTWISLLDNDEQSNFGLAEVRILSQLTIGDNLSVRVGGSAAYFSTCSFTGNMLRAYDENWEEDGCTYLNLVVVSACDTNQ